MNVRIFTEPQQGASYAQQRDFARATEAEGFDGYFRSDHYLKMGNASGRPGPTDSWITLAGLARETSTIRLGTLVTSATFRLPGVLAISVAEVDEMSGGRIELGLGAGWYDAEHTAYGIPFPTLGERFERLEEQLAIVTGLWETPEDETFSYAGRHYTLTDSPALPKPVQRPHPPLIIGGGGERRTPRLAATYADEFNTPFMQPDAVRGAFARVDDACRAIGRDPSSLVHSSAMTVVCGRDAATISRRVAAAGWDEGALRRSGACGSPEEVAERLAEWRGAGAERLYLQILDFNDLDHLGDLRRACEILNDN
jgi:F420-dependent oxidoreductase-like protein